MHAEHVRRKWVPKAFRLSKQVVCLRHAGELARHAHKVGIEKYFWRQAEKWVRQDSSTGLFGHRLELAKNLLVRKEGRDLTEALELLNQELLVQRDSEAYSLLVRAYAAKLDFAKITEMLSKAIRSSVPDPQIYQLAAQIYQKLGNEGRAAFFKSLSIRENPRVEIQVFFRWEGKQSYKRCRVVVSFRETISIPNPSSILQTSRAC